MLLKRRYKLSLGVIKKARNSRCSQLYCEFQASLGYVRPRFIPFPERERWGEGSSLPWRQKPKPPS